jgi:hypothetical protein
MMLSGLIWLNHAACQLGTPIFVQKPSKLSSKWRASPTQLRNSIKEMRTPTPFAGRIAQRMLIMRKATR